MPRRYTPLSQLVPLGKLQPGATFASVSVPILSNLTGVNTLTLTDVNVVAIQFDPTSAGGGKIYICTSADEPQADRSNVLHILESPGDSWPQVGGPAINNLDAADFYIGADNATDFAIGYIRR
jgi:hypothetical protein